MVSYCDKYVQIKLLRGSGFLNRVLTYTNKHFKSKYRLSGSILILDDGEKLKKDYLVSWCHYANCGLFDYDVPDDKFLDEVLHNTHLPIRIKIIGESELLEKIKIKVKTVASSRVVLILERNNSVAKRYIRSVFGDCFVGSHANELYLSTDSYTFWKRFMNFVCDRVIHNVALGFEYDSFLDGSGFGGAHQDEFLTEDEALIRRYYRVLNSNYGDDFCTVKKRYLELAKLYHPDRVHGKSDNVILEHAQKFRNISEAYRELKYHLALVC